MNELPSSVHDGHLGGLNPDAMQCRNEYKLTFYICCVNLFNPMAFKIHF